MVLLPPASLEYILGCLRRGDAVARKVAQHHGHGLRARMSFGGVKVLDPNLMCTASADQNNTFLGLGSDAVHEPTLRQESGQRYEHHRRSVTLVAPMIFPVPAVLTPVAPAWVAISAARVAFTAHAGASRFAEVGFDVAAGILQAPNNEPRVLELTPVPRASPLLPCTGPAIA